MIPAHSVNRDAHGLLRVIRLRERLGGEFRRREEHVVRQDHNFFMSTIISPL
jgi:hypothetical protein